MDRKVSTVSFVSLGDTPFNLEEATNIPHSQSLPLIASDADKERRSPHGHRRQKRARLSREESFDDVDQPGVVVGFTPATALDDIAEAARAEGDQKLDDVKPTGCFDESKLSLKPKPLETDLDDLSMSSHSTVTSRSDMTSSSRSQTPIPTVCITDIPESNEKKDATLTRDVSDSDLPNRPYPSVSEDAVNSDEILEKDTPKSHSDENKNLLQLNVNEKGNIVKISVTNSVSPATEATSQSADEGERPDKTKGIFDVTKTSTNIAIAQYRLDYKSIQHTLTRREFLRRPPDLHLYLCYNTPFRNNVKLPYL